MSDNPSWLKAELEKQPQPQDLQPGEPPQPDPDMEIIDYLTRGIIAFKRLIMTPNGTSNEKDAANDLAKIILEGREKFGDAKS